MAAIEGKAACIDRWEASFARDGGSLALSRRLVEPASRVTWAEAASACRGAKKRLCKVGEWKAACSGPVGERPFPYGFEYEPLRCNGLGAAPDGGRAGLAPTGSFPRCKAVESEVWDLSGNVWEWVDEPAYSGLQTLCGGGFSNAYHDLCCDCEEMKPDQRQLPIGFRCCKDN